MSRKNRPKTASGAPVDDDQNAPTAGPCGPALTQGGHLMEKLTHLNRERISERVSHAGGPGADGVFERTDETGGVDTVWVEMRGRCRKSSGAKKT